jgi:hypothetical protein
MLSPTKFKLGTKKWISLKSGLKFRTKTKTKYRSQIACNSGVKSIRNGGRIHFRGFRSQAALSKNENLKE